MKHLFILLLVPASLLLNSCKKLQQGCTDTLASNYDKSAEMDNGDCKYAADILIWYDSNGSAVTYSASDVKFLVDGSVVGTSSASLGQSTPPNCTTPDIVKFNFEMAKNKAGIYALEIRLLSDNSLLYTEKLNLISSTCNFVKLN